MIKKFDLLDASCRVALAALLHDLGKLAERARIEVPTETIDANKQLYCPHRKKYPEDPGSFSHIHAAYTAIALDLLEDQLPPLKGADVYPFATWKGRDVEDSLINAAARHHCPETFLQWVIATADRLASGFEREEFEAYNRAGEGTATGRDHYTARLLTLFEQIQLEGERPKTASDFHWRYVLKPMNVEALFPRPAGECEQNDRRRAQAEYKALWEMLRAGLNKIPVAHRDNWPLWLDHFDSLWASVAHAIPSATAGKVKPEVSLYDHAHTTAALATALWRWYHARTDDPAEVAEALHTRSDYEENKFLLVLGDFFGIQAFIMASGSQTQKKAAKLLRGRSFYVSLLTECAALKVLEELSLPPTSQVINAAGKFLIVAPNTDETKDRLAAIQKELDHWFLDKTYGTSGIGLAWEEAAANDFLRRGEKRSFRGLLKRLFEHMETMKSRRLNLCGKEPPTPAFQGFLDRFNTEKGVCAIDGRSPATESLAGTDAFISPLAADQIDSGKWLAHNERLLITTEALDHCTLKLDVFGYRVSFTSTQKASGHCASLAPNGALRRAWDFSLPLARDKILFSGYARRFLNAYVPYFGALNANDQERYQGLETEADPKAPKTFELLACDDQYCDEQGRWAGVEALTVLKGDVDNLGAIFQKGLEQPSFAKWAALSRQMNAFFAVWLPWFCREHFHNTYTVFAGGDDFFLIGPWRSTIELARSMRQHFRKYVAQNPGLHFSAGLLMAKPGLPVRQLESFAEKALEEAKALKDKNAVSLFRQSLPWDEFDALWQVLEGIEKAAKDLNLSTVYLYRLQELANMAQQLNKRPEYAIWKSWFGYRTWRLLEKEKMSKQERRTRMAELWQKLGEPIERHGSRFTIPLFLYLYQQRR